MVNFIDKKKRLELDFIKLCCVSLEFKSLTFIWDQLFSDFSNDDILQKPKN